MIYSRVVFPKLTVSLTNHHPPPKNHERVLPIKSLFSLSSISSCIRMFLEMIP